MALVSGGVDYAGTLLMLLQKWQGSTEGTTADDTMPGAVGRAYRGLGKVCRDAVYLWAFWQGWQFHDT